MDKTKQLLAQRELNLIRRCIACNSEMSTVGSFLRWHSMDFCNVNCLNDVLKRYHADNKHRCWECVTQIKISNLFVHTAYIEAELRSFCSEKCSVACLDAIHMCDYCQKKMTADRIAKASDKNGMIFCSSQCEEDYKRIVDGSTELTSGDDTFCKDSIYTGNDRIF